LRVPLITQIGSVPNERELQNPKAVKDWAVVLSRGIIDGYEKIVAAVNGRLGFGDGLNNSPADNFAGTVFYFTIPLAGVEVEITHNLGAIPIGFLVLLPPVSGVINTGVTPWTTAKMYLTCTVAGQTVRIAVLAPSQNQ